MRILNEMMIASHLSGKTGENFPATNTMAEDENVLFQN